LLFREAEWIAVSGCLVSNTTIRSTSEVTRIEPVLRGESWFRGEIHGTTYGIAGAVSGGVASDEVMASQIVDTLIP